MTNIHHNIVKSTIESRFCIDSFKLLIDQDAFTSINIPNDFKLIDSNGEIIDEFKRNSIKVHYELTDIYIGAYTKQLKGKEYKKVCILFSSKAAGQNYFKGITKSVVCNVLNYLKQINRLDYDNIESVYNSIYVRDLDIKKDFIFNKTQIESIKQTNKRLKDIFNHNPERCTIARKNIGIQANYRDNSSYTKPFVKFYDKSTEIVAKNNTLYQALRNEDKILIQTKFIYRWEFTIKNKDYFNKLQISDKLSDIQRLTQQQLQAISTYMYKANFGLIPKKRDVKLMSPNDFKDALMFQRLHDAGVSIYEIRDMYLKAWSDKQNHKCRGLTKFEKIYTYVSYGETAQQIQNENKFIKEWNKLIFG